MEPIRVLWRDILGIPCLCGVTYLPYPRTVPGFNSSSSCAGYMCQWTGLAPSHYLNQCWLVVNWTPRNKLQWNINQNKKKFIHENVSESIICNMAAILSSVSFMYTGPELSHHCCSNWSSIYAALGASPWISTHKVTHGFVAIYQTIWQH